MGQKNHIHHHGHSSGDTASNNIVTAFVLNLSFALVELIGGLFTNSIAILSDALHDFADSVSLAVAWVLQKKSNRKRDAKYSYGYKRFSLLGSVFLSGGSFWSVRSSLSRKRYSVSPIPSRCTQKACFGLR